MHTAAAAAAAEQSGDDTAVGGWNGKSTNLFLYFHQHRKKVGPFTNLFHVVILYIGVFGIH
jgi:hypothetical protein